MQGFEQLLDMGARAVPHNRNGLWSLAAQRQTIDGRCLDSKVDLFFPVTAVACVESGRPGRPYPHVVDRPS